MAHWRDSYQYGGGSPALQALLRILHWSLYIGRPIAGIRTRLHWTTLILPLLFASQLTHPGANFGDFLAVFLVLGLVLYGSIYLHELGHAITAQQCHYPVREIVLYFLGGVAITMGQRRNPKEDFAIIAFGPMVNFVLVAIAAGLRLLLFDVMGLTIANGWYLGSYYISFWFFLEMLFAVNLALGIFNLIPLFPLDGAGMTRALFSLKYNPNKVTLRVATIGQFVVAPLMILYFLFMLGQPGGLAGITLVIAVLGILACQREKMRARHMPIYADSFMGGGGYNAWVHDSGQPGWGQLGGGAYQDSSGAGPVYGGWADQAEDADKPQKEGYFARRRRAKQEKAAEQARLDQSKIDELLEKISREGIGALSKKEREFLNSASKKYK